MSHELQRHIWALELEQPKRTVLLAMASYANPDGTNVRPAISTIAWMTEYTERHVQRLINELIKDGLLIVIEARPSKPVHYTINIAAGKLKAQKPKKRAEKSAVEHGGESSRGDTAMSGSGVTQLCQGRGDIAMSDNLPYTNHNTIKTESADPASITAANASDTARETQDMTIDREGHDQKLPPAVKTTPIQATRQDLIFNAIRDYWLNGNGNSEGLGGSIGRYKKQLKAEFPTQPVTADEITAFAAWYKNQRDQQGKALGFPNPYKIARWIRKWREISQKNAKPAQSAARPKTFSL